jgi:hypothetical protein
MNNFIGHGYNKNGIVLKDKRAENTQSIGRLYSLSMLIFG